ncbi:hypothetical protein C0J50_3539 [Silurus asotus]|uniref:Uncharacterized protein n=1 Tax=Silurus asotus TaxID=30991 RepID=A0AAD5ADS9_SILAS|nr:hypothetical protein C0J50_3539 [Silurus asotus]
MTVCVIAYTYPAMYTSSQTLHSLNGTPDYPDPAIFTLSAPRLSIAAQRCAFHSADLWILYTPSVVDVFEKTGKFSSNGAKATMDFIAN